MHSVMHVIYGKTGISKDEFTRHFVEVHGAIGKRLPNVQRYEMYPVLSADGELGPTVAGFALVEFESEEAFLAAGASEAMQEAVDDMPNFARHVTSYLVSGNRIT